MPGRPGSPTPEAARHHRLAVQLHDGAQDRWPRDNPHLRERGAGARRDPRRRPIGEDVTRNLRTIVRCRCEIHDAPGLIEVRGEVYLPISAFKELNEARAEAGEPTFANPRNSAAGSIRQLDPALRRTAALDLDLRIGAVRASRPADPHGRGPVAARARLRVNPDTEHHRGVDEVVSAGTSGRSGASSSTTRSTASSSKSTSLRSGASSASSAASRAGRSPGSSRRRRRRRS